MFWWVSSLILTVMMGVLAVMSEWSATRSHEVSQWYGLAGSEAWMPGLSASGFRLVLVVLGVVLAYLSHRLSVRQSACQPAKPSSCPSSDTSSATSSATSSDTSSNPSFLRWLLTTGLRYSLVMALVVISVLLTLSRYHEAELDSLNQAMRVTALVTIEGLSDSLYDPSLDTGYRQVATLTHITPLAHNSAQQMTAPWRFLASPTNTTSDTSRPLKVLLSAYAYTAPPDSTQKPDPLAAVNTLLPAQQVWMTLALKPIDSNTWATQQRVAASGFDSQRWLWTRHIAATAKIISIIPANPAALSAKAPLLAPGNKTFRWRLRQHFLERSSELSESQRQARAVTLSLLTGDRALITQDTKALYQLAGISHLLAISGTHVLFLAIMLSALVVTIVTRVAANWFAWLPRWQLRWWVMVVTAFLYAAFTGFDVPAARTAWMLVAIGVVRLSLVPIGALKVLLALAVLMAWADPLVLWQVGYWLSFIAVALLLLFDQAAASGDREPRLVADTPLLLRVSRRLLASSWQLIKLQLWLFIALLPLTLLLFGKVSLWGLVINLFAIGLYGMVIVPLNLLAGVCYLLSPTVAAAVWQIVTAIVQLTHSIIATIVGWQVLSRQNEAWLYTPVNFGTLIIVTLILLPWLLPTGLLSRWLALPPLSLLMVTMLPTPAEEGRSAIKVYLLPTTESYLQVVLIKAQRPQAHWLLLADYRSSSQLSYLALKPKRVSERLHQQLGALGVKRLQGMVIQTAPIVTASDRGSAASTPTLATVATTLMQQMPTDQWWLAGELTTVRPDADPQALPAAVTCQAGQRWQSGEGDISIEAITGWPKLKASSVASCALTVASDQPIEIYQFSAAQPLAPTLIATSDTSRPAITKTAIEKAVIKKTAIEKTTIESSAKPQHYLVVDAANHPLVWPLWGLLCPQPVKPLPLASSILLTHSHSQIQQQHRQQLAATTRINQLGQIMSISDDSLPATRQY